MGWRPPRGAPPGGEDDLALVLRALVEPDAANELFRRFLTPVYRFCLSRLRDEEDARDATSVTMQRAFAALAGFRGGSLEAWLIVIARNACADHVRRRPRVAAGALDDLPELEAPGPSPEDFAMAAADRDRLDQALGRLPQRQERIVRLHLLGLTGPEIARRLGISHDLVRQEQRRALLELADLLDDGGEGRDG